MISHQHKCILVHVPKTAGQSIEYAFFNLLGLTWETRAPLLMRPRTSPAEGPPRLAHLKAREYVSCGHITQAEYDSYFTFSFVRNPFSRMVSFYHYLGHSRRHDFKPFVLSEFMKTEWQDNYWFVGPQHEFNCDEEGKPLVDFIGRLENLQNDFDHVCDQLKIPHQTLGHKNKAASSRPLQWQDYYDDQTRDFVAELYKQDLDIFDYSFE